mgnify:CR=1 FL=1
MDKNLKADSLAINGQNGQDGAAIKGGTGKAGVDGTNITRLVIEEKNGTQHDIATLDDGMKYGGDTGNVIKKKLNEQVNVVGGITDTNKLTTEDNLGVVSDGNNNLKVRMAKDLKRFGNCDDKDSYCRDRKYHYGKFRYGECQDCQCHDRQDGRYHD